MNQPYFECHVTVAPVFNSDLDIFKHICAKYDFKVAELLMKKDEESTGGLSKLDSFSSAKSQMFSDINERLSKLLIDLKNSGFTILRYKIEFSAWDSKYFDFQGVFK